MATWVRLTSVEGPLVWVNLDQAFIIEQAKDGDYTTIEATNGSAAMVKETVLTIAALPKTQVPV